MIRQEPERKRDAMKACLTAAVMCAVALATPQFASDAWAQSSAWFDTGGGQMRIVVEPPANGTETLRAMLELNLEPGWSTYWRDPGASGIPPQIDVSASAGVSDARIHFPAPVWIENPYGDYAGYYGSVTFPITMNRLTDGPAELVADLFLGICEDICIPVQARLQVDVTPANGTTLEAVRVDAAHDSLPGTPRSGFMLVDPPEAPPGGGYIAVNHLSTSDDAKPSVFVHAPDGTSLKPPRVAMSGGGETVYLVEPARPSDGARSIETLVTVTAGGDSFEVPHTLHMAAQ